MAKTLDALLAEADSLIMNKVAGVKAPSTVDQDDDIFKLAEAVRRGGDKTTKIAEDTGAAKEEDFSLIEKVAHAAAIVDVWRNLPKIMKIAEFETKAVENGYTGQQISEFIEKNASFFEIKSVL